MQHVRKMSITKAKLTKSHACTVRRTYRRGRPS
jgi:hypothetical protein